MQKIRDFFYRFMAGRYGGDELGRGGLWLYIVLLALNLWLKNSVLSVLELAVAVLCLLRALSRNLPARQAENEKYLALRAPVLRFFTRQRNRWRDRKTHVYRKCPGCRTFLRLPKTRGSHTCRCPQCGREFRVDVR